MYLQQYLQLVWVALPRHRLGREEGESVLCVVKCCVVEFSVLLLNALCGQMLHMVISAADLLQRCCRRQGDPGEGEKSAWEGQIYGQKMCGQILKMVKHALGVQERFPRSVPTLTGQIHNSNTDHQHWSNTCKILLNYWSKDRCVSLHTHTHKKALAHACTPTNAQSLPG
jgi:hypothetical protein